MSFSFRSAAERLKAHVRDVPDFPKPGILFKDITPILSDPELFHLSITLFAERYQRKSIDKIVAIDARGFILGAALAYQLRAGFVPLRKKGKLPSKSFAAEYELEYGVDGIELHVDALQPTDRVVLVDDLLATGGTARAGVQLIAQAQAQLVEIAFLIELNFLKGRQRLEPWPIFSAIAYDA